MKFQLHYVNGNIERKNHGGSKGNAVDLYHKVVQIMLSRTDDYNKKLFKIHNVKHN